MIRHPPARPPGPPASNKCFVCCRYCGERWETTNSGHLSKRAFSLRCPVCTREMVFAGAEKVEAMTITVRELHALAGAGNLKGFAVVEVGPFTIHGCRIIQQPGQRPYVALPQEKTSDGRYFPVVQTQDRSLKDALQTAVLSAWEGREEHDHADR